MSTDIVRGMTLVGFIVGIAVAGLVAYSLTLSQLRDWGVLRAIGLSARRALAMVVVQVGVLVVAGPRSRSRSFSRSRRSLRVFRRRSPSPSTLTTS